LACGQAASPRERPRREPPHQGDYHNSTLVNEYSYGDDTNSNGTYAPVMGAAYYTQPRRVGALGDSDNGGSHTQNDVSVILGNSGIGGFVNDGIGHTWPRPRRCPCRAPTSTTPQAKGIITPNSTSSPTPIGASNYTTDFFSFTRPVGRQPGRRRRDRVPHSRHGDVGATLRSTLTILDQNGDDGGHGPSRPPPRSAIVRRPPAAGQITTAEIASFGGHSQTLDRHLDVPTTFTSTWLHFLTGRASRRWPEPGDAGRCLRRTGGVGFFGDTGEGASDGVLRPYPRRIPVKGS